MGLETLWRGYSHWTMGLCGGLSLMVVYQLDRLLPLHWIVQKATAGCLFVTLIEFLTGCVVNLWLDMRIWDYSGMQNNLFGQICLPFTGIWFFLCSGVFLLFAAIRVGRSLLSKVEPNGRANAQ